VKETKQGSQGAASMMSFPKDSLGDKVMRLILWEDDPTNSAIALGSGLLFVFLLEYADYTFVSLVSYLIMLQLAICFLYVNGMKLYLRRQTSESTKADSVSTSGSSNENKEYLTSESVRQYFEQIANTLNPIIHFGVTVMKCKDNALTLKVMGVVFLVAFFGSCFSGSTLFFLAYLSLFTLPKLYLLNREAVDAQAIVLWKQITDATNIIFANIPGLKNKAE